MAPAGRRRRQAPLEALLDELVGEILCRIPPDDLASLLRAALVCKRWGRIISDPGFRRRFPLGAALPRDQEQAPQMPD